MNKKVSALFMVLALIVSMIPMKSAEAHSVLENSTPKEGATLEKPVEHIELSFNTKIEKGSTLYVLNQKGEKIEPTSVTVKGNVLQASFKESLASGTYQVKWKILGADGHLIEKQYSFTASTTHEGSPDTNNPGNSGQTDKANPETENPGNSTSQQQETDEKKASQQVKSENESNPSPFMYGMIIVILIAGALLLFWMLFSKKRQ
ncbi:copper resistance protein CopC [Halobacillus shinanisalinarum]|uniref:Copper resistance protein CopC n=1 Tax=Halobacillus shinanisalinarum TaxID=2932258 RepID=A0ABY4H2X7_9BACI|nr:copper resistance protein CopC [Halobacillus shinanisalinarum]UOQ93977.1 copper resistance protein CopC [Halobacillus shinanisalinarum]